MLVARVAGDDAGDRARRRSRMPRSSAWSGSPRRWAHGPARPTRSPPIPAPRDGSPTSSARRRFATDALVADPERIRALADGVVHADDAQADLVRVVARYAARELSPAATGAAIAAGGRARRCGRRSTHVAPTAAACRDRDGQARRPRADFASDLDVVFVYEGEGPDEQRAAIDAAERIMRAGARGGLGDRCRPPSRGPQRPAGAVDRRVPGVLGALRRALGVPGVAAGAGRSPATRRSADASRAAAADLAYPPDGITVDRVARDPPHARADRTRARASPRGDQVPFQAGVRLAGRRAVRGRDVAAPPRRADPGGAHHEHAAGRSSCSPIAGCSSRRSRATWARRSCS